ncbi:MAG: transglycosylase SLT domain-containing protein [Candidatus Aenigmatarchaeota archaeon]
MTIENSKTEKDNLNLDTYRFFNLDIYRSQEEIVQIRKIAEKNLLKAEEQRLREQGVSEDEIYYAGFYDIIDQKLKFNCLPYFVKWALMRPVISSKDFIIKSEKRDWDTYFNDEVAPKLLEVYKEALDECKKIELEGLFRGYDQMYKEAEGEILSILGIEAKCEKKIEKEVYQPSTFRKFVNYAKYALPVLGLGIAFGGFLGGFKAKASDNINDINKVYISYPESSSEQNNNFVSNDDNAYPNFQNNNLKSYPDEIKKAAEKHGVDLGKISEIAKKYGIDEDLFVALIYHESGFNPNAKSKKGAIGLGQILPATGSTSCDLNENDLYNWEKNAECSAKILSNLFKTYKGDVEVLKAYHAGTPENANAETEKYVKNILLWKEQIENANKSADVQILQAEADKNSVLSVFIPEAKAAEQTQNSKTAVQQASSTPTEENKDKYSPQKFSCSVDKFAEYLGKIGEIGVTYVDNLKQQEQKKQEEQQKKKIPNYNVEFVCEDGKPAIHVLPDNWLSSIHEALTGEDVNLGNVGEKMEPWLKANPEIKDPNFIYPGQKLNIPDEIYEKLKPEYKQACKKRVIIFEPSTKPGPKYEKCPRPDEAAKVLGINVGQVEYLGGSLCPELNCYKTTPGIEANLRNLAKNCNNNNDKFACGNLDKFAEKADENKDYIITYQEYSNLFNQIDDNKDGKITTEELKPFCEIAKQPEIKPEKQPPESLPFVCSDEKGSGWGPGGYVYGVTRQITYEDKNGSGQWDADEPLFLWEDLNDNKKVDEGEKYQVRIKQKLSKDDKIKLENKIKTYTQDLEIEPCDEIVKYLERIEVKPVKIDRKSQQGKDWDIDIYLAEEQKCTPKHYEEPYIYAVAEIPTNQITDPTKLNFEVRKFKNGEKPEHVDVKKVEEVDKNGDGKPDVLRVTSNSFEAPYNKRWISITNPHFGYTEQIPSEPVRKVLRNYAPETTNMGYNLPDTKEEYLTMLDEMKQNMKKFAEGYKKNEWTRISPHGQKVKIEVKDKTKDNKWNNWPAILNNQNKALAAKIGAELIDLYKPWADTPEGRLFAITSLANDIAFWERWYEALPGGRIDDAALNELEKRWYLTTINNEQNSDQNQKTSDSNNEEDENGNNPFTYPGFEDNWMNENEKLKMGLTWLSQRASVLGLIKSLGLQAAEGGGAIEGLPPTGVIPPGPTPGGVPNGPPGPTTGGVPAP